MAGALDDELLALAGSSEDEGSRPRTNKRSPSHGKSSLAKKRRLDLLDESGSGSDADAPGSDDDAAPTRRARPRASSSDDEVANPYPYQGIYKSARDMEELMAMNELEREDILARRRDELNQRRQKVELANLVKMQQAAAGASKKAARKHETKSKRRVVRGGGDGSDSDLSESEDEDADGDSDFAYSGAASAAKSRRKKMPGQTDAKSAKLSELRKKRKEKAAGTTSRVSDDEDKVRSRRGYASSSDDDSYASSDDDDPYSRRAMDTRRSRADEGGSSEPPSLAELNAARISRERIEQRLYAPRWKDVLTGAFIRFAWRRAREDGQGTEEVYRIHQVTDVHEKPGKFYDLSDDRSGRWCNVYLAFEHAGEEREIRLSNLSRSPFIESERERWLLTLPAYKQKIPRASSVAAKADELEKFFDTPLTEADIKKVLEHKKKIRTQAASVMGSGTPSTTDSDGGKSLEARLAAVHEKNRAKDRSRPDAKLKHKLAPSTAASGTATPTAPEHRQPAPQITNKFVTLPNFAATVNVDLGDF